MNLEFERKKTQDRFDKRVHVALPIRLTHGGNGSRSALSVACTYDIHSRGARVASLRTLRIGETISVERGKTKALCRVVWAGDADSDLRGQFGIECIEDEKILWEEELRETEEVYNKILKKYRPAFRKRGNGNQPENRRTSRFDARGLAHLVQGPKSARVEGHLKQISEFGCRVNAKRLLSPGTDLKLILNIEQCDVTFKGQVRHAAQGPGMGIEFFEIRRGDRPLLQYLLSRLSESNDLPENLKFEMLDF